MVSDDSATVDLRLDRPHSARMYDYFLGGNTNFPPDREAAAQAMTGFPAVRTAARANRRFVQRSTRFLATEGMRQFLDIGTGIPTSPNLHEIAQRVVPSARVVYADNDPIVLAHAAALLHSHPDGSTAYAQSDVTDPAGLLAAPEVRATIDFGRPVALSLNAVLQFVPDALGAHAIVEHLKAALPSGSTLTISHLTADFDPPTITRLIDAYRANGTVCQARDRAELTRFFDGWRLLAPGIVATCRWRPDPGGEEEGITPAQVAAYAAIARKP
jgi:S-adenosyl methyltransferase